MYLYENPFAENDLEALTKAILIYVQDYKFYNMHNEILLWNMQTLLQHTCNVSVWVLYVQYTARDSDRIKMTE